MNFCDLIADIHTAIGSVLDPVTTLMLSLTCKLNRVYAKGILSQCFIINVCIRTDNAPILQLCNLDSISNKILFCYIAIEESAINCIYVLYKRGLITCRQIMRHAILRNITTVIDEFHTSNSTFHNIIYALSVAPSTYYIDKVGVNISDKLAYTILSYAKQNNIQHEYITRLQYEFNLII